MYRIYYILGLSLFLYSCATVFPAPGGDRDLEAPKVLIEMPVSGSANYQGDVIEILLDEYFTILAGEENILITPNMPVKPTFTVKGKKLLIKLPENLDEELTYSITFLDAIRDYNEGNVLKTFKYVFTKGQAIDSASLSGKVVDAAYNQSMENICVGLYYINDTAVLSESKPVYIAKTNEQGEFKVDFVKEGDYIVAALNDKNFNYIFDQQSEELSIPSAKVSIVGKVILQEDMRIFENETSPKVLGYKLLKNNKLYFYFNQEIEQLGLDVSPYNEDNLAYLNTGNDTLFYYWTEKNIDQINFYFSLDNGEIDTTRVALKNIEDFDKFIAPTTLASNEELIVLCPKPVKQLVKNRILVLDSLNDKVSFELTYNKEELLLHVKSLTTSKILLQIDSGAVEYYDGSFSNNRFMKYVDIVPELSESNLYLSFEKPSPENAYLELLNKDKKKLQQFDISKLSKLAIEGLNPGTYYIKIYDDRNQNGKWTTGNFELARKPEMLYILSQPLEIKANWDKELTLNF